MISELVYKKTMASPGSWMSSMGFFFAKYLVNYRFLSVLSALQRVVTLPVNLPFIYITSHLEHFSQRRYHETLIKKSLWIIICDGSGKMFDKRLQDPVSLFNGGDFVLRATTNMLGLSLILCIHIQESWEMLT